MLDVEHGKEIVLHVRNDMGILGEVAKLVSERGIGITAVAGNVDGELDVCVLRLITEDNLRTCDILREHGYNPVEESVVLLEAPHKPGMLKKLTKRLGDEEIRYEKAVFRRNGRVRHYAARRRHGGACRYATRGNELDDGKPRCRASRDECQESMRGGHFGQRYP